MNNLGLHLIKTPSGKFSFVGSVPFYLGFCRKDGTLFKDSETDREFVKGQLLLPSNYRTIKDRVFESAVAAVMIAKECGFTVSNWEVGP